MTTLTASPRRGSPSRFAHFPDENRRVLEPHNTSQWHDTALARLAGCTT